MSPGQKAAGQHKKLIIVRRPLLLSRYAGARSSQPDSVRSHGYPVEGRRPGLAALKKEEAAKEKRSREPCGPCGKKGDLEGTLWWPNHKVNCRQEKSLA